MPRRSQQAPAEYETYKQRLAGEIGKRIKERRMGLGLEQESIRAKLELQGGFISRSSLSRIEQGQALPDAAQIIGLAEALQLSVEWLLRGDLTSL